MPPARRRDPFTQVASTLEHLSLDGVLEDQQDLEVLRQELSPTHQTGGEGCGLGASGCLRLHRFNKRGY